MVSDFKNNSQNILHDQPGIGAGPLADIIAMAHNHGNSDPGGTLPVSGKSDKPVKPGIRCRL